MRPSDAGTYTCDPHLATPANVTVHVVTGESICDGNEERVGIVEGGKEGRRLCWGGRKERVLDGNDAT